MQIIAPLQRFRCLRREAVTESGGPIKQAKKDCFRRRRKRLRVALREQRLVERRAFLRHDQVAANYIGSRTGIACQCRNGSGIRAKLCRAVDATIGISETGFGTKVWARRHALRKFARR